MTGYIISTAVLLVTTGVFAAITIVQQREIKAMNKIIERMAASRDEMEKSIISRRR